MFALPKFKDSKPASSPEEDTLYTQLRSQTRSKALTLVPQDNSLLGKGFKTGFIAAAVAATALVAIYADKPAAPAISAQLATATAENTALHAQLKQAQDQVTANANAAAKQVAGLQSVNNTLTEKNTGLQAANNTLTGQVQQLQNQNTNLQVENGNLKGQIKGAEDARRKSFEACLKARDILDKDNSILWGMFKYHNNINITCTL